LDEDPDQYIEDDDHPGDDRCALGFILVAIGKHGDIFFLVGPRSEPCTGIAAQNVKLNLRTLIPLVNNNMEPVRRQLRGDEENKSDEPIRDLTSE
jgi:hypothetical protein